MDISKIKYILENFNSLKWDTKSYNDFINQIKMLDFNTLDDDMKLKVNSFLQQIQNQNLSTFQNTTTQENQPIVLNDNQEINPNKDKKKHKIILIIVFIIIIIIILTIFYLIGIFNLKKNNQNLICNINSYDTTYMAEVSSNIEMSFDKNDFIDTIKGTVSYKFDNKTNYNKWKKLYNSNSNNEFIDFDFNAKYEFNDSNNSLKLIIDQTYSQIPNKNLNNDFPTNYNDIKSHYRNLGYICNGEKIKDKTNNTKNNETLNKLFSITDTISSRNNLFEYKNYKYEYNEEFGSAIIWLGSITNITNEVLLDNIRIKFYDINKNCIGDYQHKTKSKIEDIDSVWSIAPNETKNTSFTIYNDDLYENNNLSDVKYLSIEEIIFNE